MTMSADERAAIDELDIRLRTILPEEYQDSYQDVQPVPMKGAGLKYGIDGKVAWNDIWGSFCDLAMAGGPPHKGMLLEPATKAEIDAQPDRYAEVVEELCRGVGMVTGLAVQASPVPGWIRVTCLSNAMAGWLVRAIVVENVAVRGERNMLDLPAAPGYRLEKEIKNVVTVIAKTCHYWTGHMPRAQQRAIADLFLAMAEESPLVAPGLSTDHAEVNVQESIAVKMAEGIQRETGFVRSSHRYAGWLGVECPTVRAAVWIMRTLVVSNVLSRREGTVLFVPVNPGVDPEGAIVVDRLARLKRLAVSVGML